MRARTRLLNATLIATTVRQLVSHAVRVGAMAGWFLLPLLQVLIDPIPELSAPLFALPFAVIAAAGILGGELASGSMALVFTRPVSRASYVMSRWVAATLVASSLAVAQTLAQALVLALRTRDVAPFDVAMIAADRMLLCAGTVATFVLLSALTTSLFDLAAWLGAHLAAAALAMAADTTSLPPLRTLASAIRALLQPQVELYRLAVAPFDAVRYLLIVTAALALAIAILNRRELSYATAH